MSWNIEFKMFLSFTVSLYAESVVQQHIHYKQGKELCCLRPSAMEEYSRLRWELVSRLAGLIVRRASAAANLCSLVWLHAHVFQTSQRCSITHRPWSGSVIFLNNAFGQRRKRLFEMGEAGGGREDPLEPSPPCRAFPFKIICCVW